MRKQDAMPSETEWLILEILWKQDGSLTSAEIIERLKSVKDMTPKTVRVLINRLCQKGLLSYVIDAKDSRVYHYTVTKSREACLREKSRHFVDSYFAGNSQVAVASLLENTQIDEKQKQALWDILNAAKEN